jgi:hypothetical protein
MAPKPPRDSDRDFPPPPDDREESAKLIAKSETLETYDDSIRARFGRLISSIATKRRRSR